MMPTDVHKSPKVVSRPVQASFFIFDKTCGNVEIFSVESDQGHTTDSRYGRDNLFGCQCPTNFCFLCKKLHVLSNTRRFGSHVDPGFNVKPKMFLRAMVVS